MTSGSELKFPARSRTPSMMLENIARFEGDQIEDVLVIARMKNDACVKWSTSHDVAFLSVSALAVADLANRALRGEIVDE